MKESLSGKRIQQRAQGAGGPATLPNDEYIPRYLLLGDRDHDDVRDVQMRHKTRAQDDCPFVRRGGEGFSQVRRLPNGNKSRAELAELPAELADLLVIPGHDTVPRSNQGLILQLRD